MKTEALNEIARKSGTVTAGTNTKTTAPVQWEMSSKPGRTQLSLTVTATQAVDLVFELGRLSDGYNSLPHLFRHTLTANKSLTLFIPTNASLMRGQAYIDNTTGVDATYTLDGGYMG